MVVEIFIVFESLTSKCAIRARHPMDGQGRRQGPEQRLEGEGKLERIHGERDVIRERYFQPFDFHSFVLFTLDPFKIPSINYSMLSDRSPSPKFIVFQCDAPCYTPRVFVKRSHPSEGGSFFRFANRSKCSCVRFAKRRRNIRLRHRTRRSKAPRMSGSREIELPVPTYGAAPT